MESIYTKGRDNARTPMQWDDSVNAGFTTGIPWMEVNPNYTEINAEKGIRKRKFSILLLPEIDSTSKMNMIFLRKVIFGCFWKKMRIFSLM